MQFSIILTSSIICFRCISASCNRVDSPDGLTLSIATDICMQNKSESGSIISFQYSCIDGIVNKQIYNTSSCESDPIYQNTVPAATYEECKYHQPCPYFMLKQYDLRNENTANCTNIDTDNATFSELAVVYNTCYMVNDMKNPLYSAKTECVDDGVNITSYYDEECVYINGTINIHWGCDLLSPNSYFEVIDGQCGQDVYTVNSIAIVICGVMLIIYAVIFVWYRKVKKNDKPEVDFYVEYQDGDKVPNIWDFTLTKNLPETVEYLKDGTKNKIEKLRHKQSDNDLETEMTKFRRVFN